MSMFVCRFLIKMHKITKNGYYLVSEHASIHIFNNSSSHSSLHQKQQHSHTFITAQTVTNHSDVMFRN